MIDHMLTCAQREAHERPESRQELVTRLLKIKAHGGSVQIVLNAAVADGSISDREADAVYTLVNGDRR